MKESGRLHGTEMPEAAQGAEVFKVGCLEAVTFKLGSDRSMRVCPREKE